MAGLLQAILHFSQAAHRRTTTYHSQTNGLTERLSGTLADMLPMCVDVEHARWDDILPYVTFAYNTETQKTTKMTPFSLVYGKRPQVQVEDDVHTDDVNAFHQRAEEARQLPWIRIQGQQQRDARR